MANVQYGGFRPWGTLSGGEGVFPRPLRGEVANNNSTGIFKYDILTAVSDGTVVAAAAADNGKLVGVCIGASFVKSDGKRYPSDFIPASTTFTPTTVGSVNASWVDFYPLTTDLVMEVDGSSSTGITTVAGAIGLIQENCDLATGSGDTTTGVSAMTLDISTHNTTTFNFRIISISNYPVADIGIPAAINDVTITRAKYLVVCNEGILPGYSASGI